MKKNPGDDLRDQSAAFLGTIYGEAKTEVRSAGKKVDVFFEVSSFGKKTRVYLEAKDYEKPLTRRHVVNIVTDYNGIVGRNQPAILLIVTRNRLTTDAHSFVDQESGNLRHQTIVEIELGLINFSDYQQYLVG